VEPWRSAGQDCLSGLSSAPSPAASRPATPLAPGSYSQSTSNSAKADSYGLRSRTWMSVPSRSDIRAPTPRVNQGRRCELVEANAGDESSSAFINERSVQTIDLRSEEIVVTNAHLRSRSGR
jgi:hypothetical protein